MQQTSNCTYIGYTAQWMLNNKQANIQWFGIKAKNVYAYSGLVANEHKYLISSNIY